MVGSIVAVSAVLSSNALTVNGDPDASGSSPMVIADPAGELNAELPVGTERSILKQAGL